MNGVDHNHSVDTWVRRKAEELLRRHRETFGLEKPWFLQVKPGDFMLSLDVKVRNAYWPYWINHGYEWIWYPKCEPWCWNIYQHLPEQNHPVLYTMEHMGTFTHWYPHYKIIYINSHYKWIPIIHRIIDKDLNIQISEIINKWYPDILNVDVHIFPLFSSQIWRYLLRKFYTSESSGRSVGTNRPVKPEKKTLMSLLNTIKWWDNNGIIMANNGIIMG